MIFVFWVSTFICSYNLNTHAIYISVVEITHDAEGSNVEVKIFIDDLEDAIYNMSGTRHRLIDNCNAASDDISKYVATHLKIAVNGSEKSIKWVSCDIMEDAIWLRFHMDDDDPFQKVEITANQLMELFPAQMNVIKIQSGEEIRFLRLSLGDEKGMVTFD